MDAPVKFPEGTNFFDVEGVPVSEAPGHVCRAWDVSGGRWFSVFSVRRNGGLISETKFREMASQAPS